MKLGVCSGVLEDSFIVFFIPFPLVVYRNSRDLFSSLLVSLTFYICSFPIKDLLKVLNTQLSREKYKKYIGKNS